MVARDGDKGRRCLCRAAFRGVGRDIPCGEGAKAVAAAGGARPADIVGGGRDGAAAVGGWPLAEALAVSAARVRTIAVRARLGRLIGHGSTERR
jgi:hypothetical protein